MSKLCFLLHQVLQSAPYPIPLQSCTSEPLFLPHFSIHFNISLTVTLTPVPLQPSQVQKKQGKRQKHIRAGSTVCVAQAACTLCHSPLTFGLICFDKVRMQIQLAQFPATGLWATVPSLPGRRTTGKGRGKLPMVLSQVQGRAWHAWPLSWMNLSQQMP